jgi:hypothetical protein
MTTLHTALRHRPPRDALDRMLGRDGKVLVAAYSPSEMLGVTIDFFMRPSVTADQLVRLLYRMMPGTTFVLYTQRTRLEVVR